MENDDVCAVCHETFSHKEWIALPGCGHRFHVACALCFAQHDVRCPTCRSIPEGVIAKTDSQPLRREDLQEGWRDIQRRWRNRCARRRRFLNKHPHLADKDRRMRAARDEVFEHYEAAAEAYESKCRQVWRTDPDVRGHIASANRARRRERRLERQLKAELEALGADETIW